MKGTHLLLIVNTSTCVLTTASMLRVITLWFLVLTKFFHDGMGPFNLYTLYNLKQLTVTVTAKLVCVPLLKYLYCTI